MLSVAQVIEHSRDGILQTWTEAMRRSAVSNPPSSFELTNVMPAFLTSLGRCIHAGGQSLRADQLELIERHMSVRIRQGFALNEVLTEFAALNRCMTGVLDGLSDANRPSASDVAKLFSELNLASLAVASLFNEHMLEDEQTEKRHRRQLQRIASRGMKLRQTVPTALRQELCEMLAVVAAEGRH